MRGRRVSILENFSLMKDKGPNHVHSAQGGQAGLCFFSSLWLPVGVDDGSLYQ